MANFDAQIVDLIGGTIDQTACDQWATDACKEIIHQLPAKLKAKCAAATTLNNSTTVMDMDDVGEILHVTRLSANSGGFQVPAREIPAQYGGLATDSTDLNYYGTATDPVYWIDGNTSDAATLYVKPTPEATQTAIVHHISYPTVNVSDVSVIPNFPDEAEYLVVLYTAIRQLFANQSAMSSSWDSDITTAITAVNTALDRITTYNWDDEDTFTTANSQLTRVKRALDNAESVINGDQPSSTTDAFGTLSNEDLELMSGALQIASAEIGRASAHLGEWSGIGAMAIQEANGYIAEANSRLQLDVTQYQWFGDQYTKLSAEYARGLELLKGG